MCLLSLIILNSYEACLACSLIQGTLHGAHIWQRLPILMHRGGGLKARESMVMFLVARCGARFEASGVQLLRCYKGGNSCVVMIWIFTSSCTGILFIEIYEGNLAILGARFVDLHETFLC